jgi:hypothetical protein
MSQNQFPDSCVFCQNTSQIFLVCDMVVTKMSQCHGVTARVETKMTPMTKFPTQTTIFPTNVTMSQMSQSRVETALVETHLPGHFVR